MRYRLALKLDFEKNPYAGGGNMALGWAMLKLKEEKHSGSVFERAKKIIDSPAEVRVFEYADPADMIEPISVERYEARLAEVMTELPEGSKLVKIPFELSREEYFSWLKKNKLKDSHQSRADWLNL